MVAVELHQGESIAWDDWNTGAPPEVVGDDWSDATCGGSGGPVYPANAGRVAMAPEQLLIAVGSVSV